MSSIFYTPPEKRYADVTLLNGEPQRRPFKPRLVLENGTWVCYNSDSTYINELAQEFCWYLNSQQVNW